ncbi:nicotinate (nicotinamide) nucleotide adenylyltransferase [Campylobacter sp. CLAX-7218-21]|uniref:nicotinate (nicotinamide) nucleotide adenylyltransferase n=1 Tax=Campylobacter devanensis TaxID=3161138 RepID=UPI000A35A0CD|nr:nicotinate (nicotinamide) nucleotide adenylyltransferase [Campylobacter sp. P0106]MEE3695198.1 nicotinate (nicotinamide) nucleotide adenylyltransferase [Campylobacter sp. CLAX-22107-21]MEE3712924.1 nicotinate (nicotinamide) nucleotide adenylyltransferase [Campylobacter sp. CLAX-7218-21]
MNIAIFGGSFDPPHLGHDMIVKEALKSLNINKLIIIPTFLSPFKSEFGAPPNLRLQWCRSLWENLSPKIIVSDYETSQNRAVATIESVIYFKNKFNASRIYLIIGADQLNSLHKWHRYDELKALVSFVVACRDGIKIDENLQKLDINVKISSSKIKSELNFKHIPTAILDSVEKFYKDKNAK